MKRNVVDNVANDAGIWHSSFGWLLAGERASGLLPSQIESAMEL